MNEVMNINGVDCYEKDGTAYLKLETVVKGLGFTQQKNGIEYVRWERVEQYLNEWNFPTCGDGFATCGKRPDYIPENIFYRLAMKAKNETADVYNEYVAFCSDRNLQPVSKIVFSKMVNQVLGTHVISRKLNRQVKKVFVP